MVHFVGAGSGAPDLITLRGDALLRRADVVIWAGSLVNPRLLEVCRDDCEIFDSATMTLEEVLDRMRDAEERGLEVVRLHTGDPCMYGAIQEQMDALDKMGIAYDVVPGVSSFCGAAAALRRRCGAGRGTPTPPAAGTRSASGCRCAGTVALRRACNLG